MNGSQAIKALLEGHAIRMACWTPGNRVSRIYDPVSGEWFTEAYGTPMFIEDCSFWGALWMLDALCDQRDCWEIHETQTESLQENMDKT